MVTGIWGRKIGMTQVFENDKVIPVTAIDVSNWVVTGFKTKERDGYTAVQIGAVRKRYAGQTPVESWIKKPKQYFSVLREVAVDEIPEGISVGQSFQFDLKKGDSVDVFGTTKGKGFAGVVRRWNFAGSPASHGSTMGKSTGSLGFLTREGRVIKGKKMPGHMGARNRAVKNLPIVNVLEESPVILVKGSVPGHAGSLLYLKKA